MIDLVIIHDMLALAAGIALAAASIIKPLVDVIRRQFQLSGWPVLVVVFMLGQAIVWLIVAGVAVPLNAKNIAVTILAGVIAGLSAVVITKTHDQTRTPEPPEITTVVNADLAGIYATVKAAMEDYLNGDEFGGKG